MSSLIGGYAQTNSVAGSSVSSSILNPTFNVGSGNFDTQSRNESSSRLDNKFDQKSSSDLSASAVIPVNSKTGNNDARTSQKKETQDAQPTGSSRISSAPGQNFMPKHSSSIPDFSNIDSSSIMKYGMLAGGAILLYLFASRK